MDFFSLCVRNDAQLGELFQALLFSLGATQKEVLSRFAATVASSGRIGVNMRPTVLQELLASGEWFNIHEWAEKVAHKSSKSKEGILQEKLGPFYDKRVAFDAYFAGGESFRYGALNIGGLGTERYGEFCVVLRHEEMTATCEIGYLQSDSLRTYVSDKGVDGTALEKECSSDAAKHLLCSLKHSAELDAASEETWPQMVCNQDQYVEAIFVGGLSAEKIQSVRISKGLYELYYEYVYNEYREKLSELDRYRTDTFARIDEYLDQLSIPWEEVT